MLCFWFYSGKFLPILSAKEEAENPAFLGRPTQWGQRNHQKFLAELQRWKCLTLDIKLRLNTLVTISIRVKLFCMVKRSQDLDDTYWSLFPLSKIQSLSLEVNHSRQNLKLCDPTDCSSSVHGFLQCKLLSVFPFPSLGIFPTQGSNPGLQAESLPTEPLEPFSLQLLLIRTVSIPQKKKKKKVDSLISDSVLFHRGCNIKHHTLSTLY